MMKLLFFYKLNTLPIPELFVIIAVLVEQLCKPGHYAVNLAKQVFKFQRLDHHAENRQSQRRFQILPVCVPGNDNNRKIGRDSADHAQLHQQVQVIVSGLVVKHRCIYRARADSFEQIQIAGCFARQ